MQQKQSGRLKILHESDGVYSVVIKDSRLSYLKNEVLVDSTAVAYGEAKKRSSAYISKYYPYEGVLQWNVLVQKNNDTSTIVYINLDKKGYITKFWQDGLLSRKSLKTEALYSTGVLEKQLEFFIKN